jgi:uncharacterized protein (DUF2235 family)
MPGFKQGWYIVSRTKSGNKRCFKFRDPEHYVAICTVDSNGRQFLEWQDEKDVNGPGKPGRWLPSYEEMDYAPPGDWWDNPASKQKYMPKTPGNFSRVDRKPTPRELSQRAATANPAAASGLTCTKEIHVGIFFDGTNNNMLRDKPEKSHTNVVALYDAHKDDRLEHFAYYIPGVGTTFGEIGEKAASNGDGNTFAKGGEARIHFGMLQVFNAVCSAAAQSDLLTEAEMKNLVTSIFFGLRTKWRAGDSKMVDIFRDLDARLVKAIEGKRPKVCKVNVSVVGFSRGAAQARAFVQWLQKATGGTIGGAAVTMRFLGIFDTVASVGFADSAPVPGVSGLMDWADGNMGITGIEKTAHFVAAHEIRRSFPLSTARERGAWPSGVKEFVYPGAHSDVGGGYGPGEQGKAMGGRSSLLAQIPLNDMFHEALNAGMKLLPKSEMEAGSQADFLIDPALDKAFSDYAKWTDKYDEKENIAAKGEAPNNRMRYHTQLYWRWRASVSADNKFAALSSYSNAKPQHKTDLWEAELDWRRDVEAAQQASKPYADYTATPVGPVKSSEPYSHASELQREILKQVALASDVPAVVSQFFDRYLHDSHAGFWMVGPTTQLNKTTLIQEVLDKQKQHNYLLARARDSQNPGVKRNLENHARFYELSNLEKRVLAANAATPGSVPVFTDADAAELRKRAGLLTQTTLALMGTATRREASGHGRYRRIFDQS